MRLNLARNHRNDLPASAAEALAQLADNILAIDSSATIEFEFVLPDGQRIFVTWKKGQQHAGISGLRDANNNTVPRSPGHVSRNYEFSSHASEYGAFINFPGRMGVQIGEPGGGSVWVVACTTAGGVTRCVPTRMYRLSPAGAGAAD